MIIFLTLGISSTAGHTYLAPAVSIYISIYFIYLLNEIKSFEKRKINDSKITILGLHLGYGGVENAISNIANMLEEKYEVEVISLYRKKEEPFKFNKRVKIKHLMNITSNKNEFKKALKNKQGLKILKEGIKSIYILLNKNYLLKKAIINSDSKIIISTRYSFSKILNKYGRDKTIKIHQEHTYNVNLQYIKKLNYLQNINYIMPVSKSILLKYKDKITINMKYIPLTLDYYPNKSEISDLNNNNLISIGRLENEKAMDELIYIMNGLTKNNKNVLLNIYGDGSNHQKLESLINEFKLEKNIKLWGFKPKKEIQDALKQSTLYLMTSKEESFGLVLIEAMSFGVPCIAYSSAEGAKEIIKPNTGYLIDNRDRKEYINQIENYLKYSIREKQEMGRNARKNINTYKFDTVKREWIKFINNIIKN